MKELVKILLGVWILLIAGGQLGEGNPFWLLAALLVMLFYQEKVSNVYEDWIAKQACEIASVTSKKLRLDLVPQSIAVLLTTFVVVTMAEEWLLCANIFLFGRSSMIKYYLWVGYLIPTLSAAAFGIYKSKGISRIMLGANTAILSIQMFTLIVSILCCSKGDYNPIIFSTFNMVILNYVVIGLWTKLSPRTID